MQYALLRLLIILLFVVVGLIYSEIQARSEDKPVSFDTLTLPPASGQKPTSIVVLFHGYGDNNENFIFLGAMLAEFLPDTLFVALDGPIACKTIPSGRQWVSASQKDKKKLLKEINELTPSLNAYLNNLLKFYNLPPEKMAFLGFSQGARIALHIGLRRPKCAAIVAMSGSYLKDPSAKDLSNPPILLMHGDADQKAPVSYARQSYKDLKIFNKDVTLMLLPGIAHDIDLQGVMIASEFMKECFADK